MGIVRSFLTVTALASTVLAQGVVKAPASVVQEGVPQIPASIAREVYPYRTFYGSSLLGWDPIKPQPIITRYMPGGSLQAARVETPGGTVRFFTALPQGFRELYEDPHGKCIIYRKAADSNFRFQIYRYDIDSKTSTLLTDGTSKNLYPIWSKSGKLIAYSSTRRNGSDLDIYVMDPLDPRSSRLVAEVQGSDWAVFDWSPDDRKLILSDYQSYEETHIWLLDLETGKKTLLTPATGHERAFNGSFASFSADGKGIYISTDRGSEFRRLAYVDLGTLRYTFLTDPIKWDVDLVALSPNGKTLAFVANEDGASRLHLMSTADYKELPVPDMPFGVVSELKWHSSLPYLGFVFSSTKNPADVFSLNIATGKLDRWTRAFTGAKTDGFREPEQIKWKTFDGRMISGFLYRPPETFVGKHPVIVYLHGGLHDQFHPDFREGDNYFINALGIAMIYPNIRGSSGYGKTFLSLDDKCSRPDAVKDVGALLDWIRTQPVLDADKVMLDGDSSGGYMALSVAAMYPDKISALLSYIAPTNFATLIERTLNNNPDPWRKKLGDERDKKTREFLDRIAPVNNAEKIDSPTLLIIGGKDLITSVDETQRIVARIKNKGIPVWFLMAKDEGHGFMDPVTFEYTFETEALFIKQFLLGGRSKVAAVTAK
jgi:dipeptidyl aminopeptidase/acylaminoacyl peptidase